MTSFTQTISILLALVSCSYGFTVLASISTIQTQVVSKVVQPIEPLKQPSRGLAQSIRL